MRRHKIFKLLSRRTEIRIYKSIIRPILMYRCEAWTLTYKKEIVLVTERFGKILGSAKRDDSSWRLRKSRKWMSCLRSPTSLKNSMFIDFSSQSHVVRMEEHRAVKQTYQGRPTGRHPIGRPKYRWADKVLVQAKLEANNRRPKLWGLCVTAAVVVRSNLYKNVI